jgi:hypothetical protein
MISAVGTPGTLAADKLRLAKWPDFDRYFDTTP